MPRPSPLRAFSLPAKKKAASQRRATTTTRITEAAAATTTDCTLKIKKANDDDVKGERRKGKQLQGEGAAVGEEEVEASGKRQRQS